MGHYSELKMNGLLIHATTWVDLQGLVLSEKRQSRRPIPFI